jgi:hypothetical protein
MYLKTDKIVVTIKKMVFRSGKTTAYGQYILDPTAIVGWTDGTSVRRDATVRPVSSGDFMEPYTLSSRLISLSGTAIAKTASELQVMRDNLMGLFAPGEYAEMTVQTTASTRYAVVGLEGSISWTIQTDNVAVFKIDVYAPDPYIYGDTRSFQTGSYQRTGGILYPIKYPMDFNLGTLNTAQTIKNNGNAEAWPVFKVIGDYYSGFTITDNVGSVVRYTGMVTMTAPVFVDMGRGTATQNGVDKTTLVTSREWFSIPPGGTISPRFTPIQNGSGWCDIIYRDTWI